MARPLRIQFENAYYHVTCRGNARQIIFSTDAVRSAFLDLLGRSSEIYRTDVLAYVLMEMLFRHGGLRQLEIGALLGIDYSSVSIGRKRLLRMMEADPELKSLFAKVTGRISQGQRFDLTMPQHAALY